MVAQPRFDAADDSWPTGVSVSPPLAVVRESPAAASAPPVPWRTSVVHWLARLLFGLLSRRVVTGTELIPRDGPFLLAFNHLGLLDGPLLASVLPRRDVSAIVTAEFRRRPLTRLVIEAGGGVWIGKGVGSRGALTAALRLLGEGRVVAIAPEGRISLTGALEAAKPGPVFLATQAGVPIIPVAITGTESAARDLWRLRRPRLTVRFGEPFCLPTPCPGDRKTRRQAESDQLMGRLAGLLPPAYRGVYGSSTAATTTDAA